MNTLLYIKINVKIIIIYIYAEKHTKDDLLVNISTFPVSFNNTVVKQQQKENLMSEGNILPLNIVLEEFLHLDYFRLLDYLPLTCLKLNFKNNNNFNLFFSRHQNVM